MGVHRLESTTRPNVEGFRTCCGYVLELLGRKGQCEKGWRAEGVWVGLRTRRACFGGDVDELGGMIPTAYPVEGSV